MNKSALGAMATVETFQVECRVEHFPPTTADVEVCLQSVLSPHQHVLQWFIVKTDPATQRLWVEGTVASS